MAFRALINFDEAARRGVDPALVELIQIRASHLNHCAYCLYLHANEARKAGESEDRLHMVPVWRQARYFFARSTPGTAWPWPRRGRPARTSAADHRPAFCPHTVIGRSCAVIGAGSRELPVR